MIRLVSRQPVVDAVKLAFYRPDFYGAGDLTHEAMRGPSEWSIGDRELMAAFVSQVNECPFCVAAHSATSTLWYGDDAKVTATLADVETAPIEEDDIRAALAASVSPQRIEDALAVCLAFNITDRLANAFDFSVASPEAMN